MGRTGRHVALALVTAVVVGVLAFAARGVTLPLLDRALDRITLLRIVTALAAIALLHVVVSLWGRGTHRLPEWNLSAQPASIVLGAIAGAAAGMWAALDERVTVPTVFADEFIFMSLAKGLSRGDGAVVRGVETLGYGIAYPALLAPVYALADDGAQAFTAVQTTNAVVMASAAVPAYLLARTVLERSDSLLVAAFTVATPLLVYSGHVMTEALFYPAFLWTTLAVVRALTLPSTTRQIVALGALLGLCSVRPQAVVLIPAAASAIGVLALCRGTAKASLWQYRILLAGLGGAALAAVAARLVLGTSPVGAYDVLITRPDPVELVVWAARELGGLALATGVIAVIVFPIGTILMLSATAAADERALAATALAFVVWMLASVAVLDASPYSLGWTHLRNLVAVMPLLVLVGVVWVRRDMPRPPPTAMLGSGLALLAALAVRSSDLEHVGRLDAPAFLPWRPFASQVLPLDRLMLLVVVVAVIVALTTRAQWALPVSVLAGFVVVAPEILPRDPPWGIERDRAALLAELDRAVSPGGNSIVITAGLPDGRCEGHPLALTALWTEALNTSAGAQRLFGTDLIGPYPALTIGADGTLLRDGRPVTADAVAIDDRIAVDGVPLSTVKLRDLGGEFADDPGGLRFWRTSGAVRLTAPDRVEQLASRKECPV